MKLLPTLASAAALTALTQQPFFATLRCSSAAGFFEPLFGYARGPQRHCACALHVERIEAAVDAIVRSDRPIASRRTQRIALPAPLVQA